MSSSPSCEPEESEAACAVSPFFCPAHYLEDSHLSKSAAQLAADVAAAVREISYSTVEPVALRYPPQVSGLVQPLAAPADQLPHVLGRLRAAVRRRGAAGRIRRGDGTGPGPADEVPNGQGARAPRDDARRLLHLGPPSTGRRTPLILRGGPRI